MAGGQSIDWLYKWNSLTEALKITAQTKVNLKNNNKSFMDYQNSERYAVK